MNSCVMRLAQNPVFRTILLFFHANFWKEGTPDLSGFDGEEQIVGGSGWQTDAAPTRRQTFRTDGST